ncbi:MAG: ArsR family transcriptional regulator [Nitrospirae bacterium]|nr:ArsR family transcriptional regulator [Nitrospirota bacterium]
MKIKNIRLDIQSEGEFISEAKEAMKAVAKGRIVKPKSVISFESLKTMRKFITDERLRILKAIRKYNPESIYELAKMLHRDAKNVTDDVHYLAGLGLLEIEKTKEGRHKTKPVVDYEKILVEIMV